MKARNISVTASDGDLAVDVLITITPRKGHPLEESELDYLEKKAGRLIAAALINLPYSDFGLENIRIERGGRA